jgi:membrane-bound metal-dependent hydrolase YbcI (DUF457 family)
MYGGHFGMALAGAGAAPRVPLAVLIVAAFGCDFLEAAVAAAGVVDVHRAWSHSVPAGAAIAAVLGGVWAVTRRDARGAAVLAAVALSHVVADYVTGVKALYPGGPVVGWYLNGRPWADLAVESAVIAAGWAAWRHALPAAARTRPLAWAPLALLLAAQAAFARWTATTGAEPAPGTAKFLPPWIGG